MRTRRPMALITIFICVVLACELPEETIQPTIDTYDSYQVDFQSNLGNVNPYDGIQGISFLTNVQTNLRVGYRSGSFDLVRFPVDDGFGFTLASIFPDDSRSPEDPQAYHFYRIDKQIEAILSTGAMILWQASYDIGGGDRWGRCCQGGRPPKNVAHWANVIRHVLMHFNEGWAEGHYWDIQYVEFINEPCSLGGFNCETAEGRRQLFTTYAAFANAIRNYNQEYDRRVQIVGISEPNSANVEAMQLLDDFLIYVESNHIPLDIFSYHYFGSPASQRSVAQKIRQHLVKGNFSDLPIWNTEWNMTFDDVPLEIMQTGDPAFVSAYFGTHNVLTKIYFQDILDQAVVYRPLHNNPSLQINNVGGGELYITQNGIPTPANISWQAFSHLSQQTPMRLDVISPPDDTALLAARSSDGNQMSLLISYWCKAASNVCLPRTYDLRLVNLPPGQIYRITETIIDRNSQELAPDSALSLRVGQDGILILHDRMELWSVHFWQLQAEP